MSKVIAKIGIDEQLESYRTFFDGQWADDIFEVVAGTRLEPEVDLLVVHWKSVANAHAMPWVATESLRNYGRGCVGARTPFAVELVDAMKLRLTDAIGKDLSRHKKNIVDAAVDSVASDVLARSAVAKGVAASGVRSSDIWAYFIGHYEFQMSVWGSQRLCYAGVYFGYESFVRACASLATNRPSSDNWTKGGTLVKNLKTVFGEQIVKQCITDQPVQIARLVRNALVHNAGKVTEELGHISHGLAVQDGVLQIMAPDTSGLFRQLKGRALALAQKAIELPGIK